MNTAIPESRIRRVNRVPVQPRGDHVLYWMTAARRVSYNFALDRAIAIAREHSVPLIVLEALRADYPWASDRIHAFIIQGMRDNAASLERTPIAYYPYVEPRGGAGKGLLMALAGNACAVVTDDYPCFFLPRMLEAVGQRLKTCLEAVDGNGLYPMRATDRVFTTAASFRRHLQKELPEFLASAPAAQPTRKLELPRARLPARVIRRWKPFIPERSQIAALAIDHTVAPAPIRGGADAAGKTLKSFLEARLPLYAEQRNQPEVRAQSNLSPYLHFGHISAHEIFIRLMRRGGWSPERLAVKATGSRSGWWGADRNTEAFLDELVTWREIGFNMCAHQKNYAAFASLPQWAKRTLDDHSGDPRSHTYTLAQFEGARTHDPLWNAAQRQLVREGTIHNYLRMLWGKKILEWTRSPRRAVEVMIELNNKYALDGRDPNSYSGIFWVLGRYDRAWGPERPIFGKIRYMSSDNTARKVRVKSYLERFAE
ncbi:MAG: deoxyribodipyrimidine photolyase [Proteobacteria bacterium]|nr:deoxyribodipyrimidine photolyase [Pseudomonadota bacterium]